MSNRPEPKYIAWLDLETTGNDIEHDEILEIGVVLTTIDLHEVGAIRLLVGLTPAGSARLAANEFVTNMHTKNGLLEAVRNVDWADVDRADDSLSQWLQSTTESRDHVVLAGSGVSHFDRKFVDKWLPLSAKRFTYYSLDVGVLRRALRVAGREDLYPSGDSRDEAVPHRALEDAKMFLEEFRSFKDAVGGI